MRSNLNTHYDKCGHTIRSLSRSTKNPWCTPNTHCKKSKHTICSLLITKYSLSVSHQLFTYPLTDHSLNKSPQMFFDTELTLTLTITTHSLTHWFLSTQSPVPMTADVFRHRTNPNLNLNHPLTHSHQPNLPSTHSLTHSLTDFCPPNHSPVPMTADVFRHRSVRFFRDGMPGYRHPLPHRPWYAPILPYSQPWPNHNIIYSTVTYSTLL